VTSQPRSTGEQWACGPLIRGEPDPRWGDYYVSIRDGQRTCLALGPFTNDHPSALTAVARVRKYVQNTRLDPFATYAYGTVRVASQTAPVRGRLNDRIEVPSAEEVASYLATNPPRAARRLIRQPTNWPFRVVEEDMGGEARFHVVARGDRARFPGHRSFLAAERERCFRTSPSARYELIGTGGGRLALIQVGDPRYHEGYPRSWVVLARINRALSARQLDWLHRWVLATHTLVATTPHRDLARN
jgi:hypothetical protein